MTNVLLLLNFPEETQKQYYQPLKSAFPELNINLVAHHSQAAPYTAGAEILMTFGPMLTDQLIQQATQLKWIQALGTGVDNLADLPSLRPEVIITNIHGIHGPAMSESAIMSMLALSKNFPRIARNQIERVWQRWPSRLLDGKTLGIFGIGAIAEALASRCKPLGMRIIGISSTKRQVANFDQVYGREELTSAAAEVDHFVILTPYTPDTKNIVNARVLAAMKPTAYLINLARGGVVDEQALISALETGQIAGAALDVFNTEPLPADHPFWSMENVIVTPHLGGYNDQYASQAMPVITENIRRFLAGRTTELINLVKR